MVLREWALTESSWGSGRGTQWLRDPRRNGLELLGEWGMRSLSQPLHLMLYHCPRPLLGFLLLEKKAPSPPCPLLCPQTMGDPLLPIPPLGLSCFCLDEGPRDSVGRRPWLRGVVPVPSEGHMAG